MTSIDLIIFDCDGVLVDSEPLANQVLADYLTEQGLPCSREDATARFVGLSFASIRQKLRDEDGLRVPADFDEEIMRRDRLAFENDLQAIPGVASVLERLDMRKCVASSGEHKKIRNSLTLTGLLHHFDPDIFSAADVANGKPAPDLFLHAAGQMDVPAGRCVVIEDSLAGVRAGVAAGMRVIGFLGGGHITDGHGGKLTGAGASMLLDHMSDLPSRLAGGMNAA